MKKNTKKESFKTKKLSTVANNDATPEEQVVFEPENTKTKKDKKHKKDHHKKSDDKKTTTQKELKNDKAPAHTPLHILSKFLGSVKGKHMEEVLTDLMTEKEIKEFAERVNILRMLDKGTPQRKIASDLGISVTTVSRGSKVLQQGTGKAKKYL